MASPASYAADALIEGAKLCTKHLPRYEREYGIPTHLLSAIATTESGRYHEGLKISIPWPWTINAEGKGYFYDTKDQAVAAAKKMRAQGVKSMDVGCMQVNLMHHASAFRSVESAFDPQTNIAYAASFLRNLYEENNHSWKQAASDYHSKTPSRGTQYAGRVYNSWYNIVDKLRQARLQVPQSSVVAMNDLKPAAGLQQPTKPQKPSLRADAKPGKVLASYTPVRANTIEVKNGAASQVKYNGTKENGIIIIRPDIKVVDAPVAATNKNSQVITVAQAAKSDAVVSTGAAQGAIIRASDTVPAPKGPRFVFSN